MAMMDAQQIYHNFHTHAKGTQGLAGAAQTARELAAKYEDWALTTQHMMNSLQAGWKGVAAEAASQGLAPLAENSLHSHEQLGAGQGIVSRQVDSFHTATSQVRPVPDEPRLDDMVAAAATGHDLVPVLDRMMQRHAIQQANVDAYAQYVAASQYNTANVPVLNVIDKAGAPISVTPAAARQMTAAGTSAPLATGAEASGAAVEQRRTVVAGRSIGSPESSPASEGPAASGRPTATAPAPSASGVTTTSSTTAPPTTSSRQGLDPRPMGSSEAVPTASVGGWPQADPGRSADSARSPQDRTRVWGEGESGVRVPRSDLGQPGERGGPGERSRAVTGPVEEEAVAAERGVAARSGPAGMGGPMSGGRRDKDGEHKRRYGVDEDGEARFGMAGLYAPPVIGETAAERDQRDAEELARHHRDS